MHCIALNHICAKSEKKDINLTFFLREREKKSKQEHKMQNVLIFVECYLLWSKIFATSKRENNQIGYYFGGILLHLRHVVFCDIKIISDIILNGQFYFHIRIYFAVFVFLSLDAQFFHCERRISWLVVALPTRVPIDLNTISAPISVCHYCCLCII